MGLFCPHHITLNIKQNFGRLNVIVYKRKERENKFFIEWLINIVRNQHCYLRLRHMTISLLLNNNTKSKWYNQIPELGYGMFYI